MEQVNTAEKPHEQIQLRSLTKNIAKGNAPKRKLSFIDNRPIQQKQVRMKEIIQRKLYNGGGDMKTLIDNQITLQTTAGKDPNKVTEELRKDGGHADPRFFTTVGYEFEFIQLKDMGKGTVLQNVIHANLSDSDETFGYTGLPFTLETDATETIELVTPPFIIDTMPGTSIPEPDDVQKVSMAMETGLNDIVLNSHTINQMVGTFNGKGLKFKEPSAIIKSENMLGPKSQQFEKIALMIYLELKIEKLCKSYEDKFKTMSMDSEEYKNADRERLEAIEKIRQSKPCADEKRKFFKENEQEGIKIGNIYLKDLRVVPSTKSTGGISTQVNIAMSTEDYLKVKDMENVNKGEKEKIDKLRSKLVNNLYGKLPPVSGVNWKKANFVALFNEIAMHILNTSALEGMTKYRSRGEEYFESPGKDDFSPRLSHPESSVKDKRGVWFKDSIRSLAVDLLKDEFKETKETIIKALRAIAAENLGQYGINVKLYREPLKNLADFLDVLVKRNPTDDEICTRVEGLCEAGKGFGAFDVRPDTYFPSHKLRAAPGLSEKRLHVVESRYQGSSEIVAKLRELKRSWAIEKLKEIKKMDLCLKKMEDEEGKEDEFKKARTELEALQTVVDPIIFAKYSHRIKESERRNNQLLNPYD